MEKKSAKTKKAPVKTKTTKTSASAKTKSVKLTKEPMSKSQIVACIVEHSEVPKKHVTLVFDTLTEVIHAHLKKGAAGVFNLPGLLKLYVVRKPATKARKGTNPFTGEEMMFKAKPARNVIKARVLKKLKDVTA
jgi:nucleoid DNA-binding protein